MASTGTPFYDVNLQTGEKITYEPATKMQVATQTIHHGGAHLSRILAPVKK